MTDTHPTCHLAFASNSTSTTLPFSALLSRYDGCLEQFEMRLSVVALGDVFEVDQDGSEQLKRLGVLLLKIFADPSGVRQLRLPALAIVLDDKVQQLDLWHRKWAVLR